MPESKNPDTVRGLAHGSCLFYWDHPDNTNPKCLRLQCCLNISAVLRLGHTPSLRMTEGLIGDRGFDQFESNGVRIPSPFATSDNEYSVNYHVHPHDFWLSTSPRHKES